MLRDLKLSSLRFLQETGVSARVLNSRWRQQRLLILCYHGVSLLDEHEWSPSLYVSPAQLRRRFDALRRHGCTALPLDRAVEMLRKGSLPPRSVTITFDDGTADFHRAALPILKAFGYPATVYFCTYYAFNNRPVFDTMCSYLLWKAGSAQFRLPGVLEGRIDLRTTHFTAVAERIKHFAYDSGLSAAEKDALLINLAATLQIDYESVLRQRILHLMTPEEAAEVARSGVALQLHTHRHRVSRRKSLFEREIADNRQHLRRITNAPACHFCYPSGVYTPDLTDWLTEMQIVSATTCEPGLASYNSNLLLLPRVLDTSNMTDLEFESWISGVSAFLPRRKQHSPVRQCVEDLVPGERLVHREVASGSRETPTS